MVAPSIVSMPGGPLLCPKFTAERDTELCRASQLSRHWEDARLHAPDGCVVSKVKEFERVLSDPRASRAGKQQALRFLVHFLQDLHQPLHIGDTGSRGDNLVEVRSFGVGSNLHRVWDSQIIEWHSTDEGTWLKELNALATPQMAAAWLKGRVEDWATESLAEARLACRLPGTDRLIRSGTRLGEEYFQLTLPIIQLRLTQSAVRLAASINRIFK